MKIDLTNEVFNLPDGIYEATIDDIIPYSNSMKVIVKFRMYNDIVFIKFYSTSDLGEYPWNHVFTALGSNETNDLIGRMVYFEITNKKSEKSGEEFSNIKKIKLM